jgi:hypothetical protein
MVVFEDFRVVANRGIGEPIEPMVAH